jgi:predicted dehydrogenase/threonine dehydrogenase-like Zn-dependent dehydrogenase
MKQVLQNMQGGKTSVVEVPTPAARPGTALVRTAVSLVSAGTERMLVEFAEKNLLGKARSRPDLVRQVLDKARREGLLSTLQATFNRLEQPMVLGYSSAGTIVEVGSGLTGFVPGDRVACAGGNFAVHAEYAVVPHNLLVKLPDELDFEPAAFTTLGAIALHGFRLAQPQVGERVALIGLGLLGLLAAGIARAAGCTVFGIDLSMERVDLARAMGFQAALRENAEETGRTASRGQGFDIVLICADSRSSDPVELAGVLARDRGQVIAVGAVGLEIPRTLYYEKELNFRVSRSYGPGRYDPGYEEAGQDYPFGFVRWTEGRNLQAVVDLLATKQLDVSPLISHRFPIERAAEAYELIKGRTGDPFLGVLLTYPQSEAPAPSRRVANPIVSAPPAAGTLSLGILGAGLYANATFLPAVDAVGGIQKAAIASANGVTAQAAMRRHAFGYASSSETEVLADPGIHVLAILTRHNQHARQVRAALEAGKHVYCEKPLAISHEELAMLESLLQAPGLPLLAVGFNRRFAPFGRALKEFLAGSREPFAAHYRINAGFIPLNHWLHDPAVGGGRIIGEACHFIDFLSFLADSPPSRVEAHALPDAGRYREDNVQISLRFPDGSLGSVLYLANGDKSVPKERLEVFCGGRVAILDDFRSLELAQAGHRRVLRDRLGQDKGHRAAWSAFLAAVRAGGPPPIPYADLLGVTRATFEAAESLHQA